MIRSACLLALVPAVLQAATVDLAKTGQTNCYDASGQSIVCSGTGQDGEIQAGIPWPEPRFSDNADGTITDNLTGLIWLQDTDCFGSVSWVEALALANGLADGDCGLTDGSVAGDWRLPNILELASPAHMGAVDAISWLASFGFSGMTAHGRWSSTTASGGFAASFIYQFRDRLMGIGGKTGNYRAWPVKGVATGPAKIWKTGQVACYVNISNDTIPCAGTGQDGEMQAGADWPVPRFTANGDGTVTDNLTDLIWLQDAGCFGERLWLDAQSDALALSDGSCGLADGSSAGDWRLSNTSEVTSLVDFSTVSPALPSGHPFTNLPLSVHWTSTTYPNLTSFAFFSGLSVHGNYQFTQKSSQYHVWPVRGGTVSNVPLFADGFESGDTSAWSASAP